MIRFLIPIFAITIISCSKSENPPAKKIVYGGSLAKMTRVSKDTNGNPIIVQDANAVFFEDYSTRKTIDVENVFVNGIPLRYSGSSFHEYSAHSFFIPELDMNNGAKWKVIGKGDIPSFEYEDRKPYPKLINTIPDTMSISNGLVFKLKILDADSVRITVYNGVSGNSLVRTFSTDNEEYLFPPDLTSLIFRHGSYAVIEMEIFGVDEKIFNDKKFEFYAVNYYKGGCLLWN